MTALWPTAPSWARKFSKMRRPCWPRAVYWSIRPARLPRMRMKGQIANFAKAPSSPLCDLSACGFGRPGEGQPRPGPPGLPRRIYPPHLACRRRRGAFLAKLQKPPPLKPARRRSSRPKALKAPAEWPRLCQDLLPALASRPLAGAGVAAAARTGQRGLNTAKLRVVRGGVLVGSVLKSGSSPPTRCSWPMVPSVRTARELTLADPRTAAWLRGEEIDAATAQNGWCAVLVDGFPLGGGKVSGGRIKNHYQRVCGICNNPLRPLLKSTTCCAIIIYW